MTRMGAKFAVDLQRTASTTASLGNITNPGSGQRRHRWFYLHLGCQGDAADNEFLYTIQRCTTAGTRTSVTPQPLDPADAAAVTTAGENHTVEPTYTAGEILLNIALNQRATFQWYAPPGGELVVPATASNGIGVQSPTSTALVITGQIHFEE